jgi:hypothetical protein
MHESWSGAPACSENRRPIASSQLIASNFFFWKLSSPPTLYTSVLFARGWYDLLANTVSPYVTTEEKKYILLNVNALMVNVNMECSLLSFPYICVCVVPLSI